jgi:AraC-like DNA-binding protein
MLPRSVLVALSSVVDLDAIARRCGASSASGRLTPAQSEAILGEALTQIEKSAFGLDYGARVRPELFGVAGFAAMSAPTLGGAIERIARYKRIFEIDSIEIVPCGAGVAVRIVLAWPNGRGARTHVDWSLAFLFGFARMVTATALRPVQVTLRGTPPPHRDRYAQLFECPVQFRAQFDSIVFSREDLARACVTESSELNELFGARAESLLAGGDDNVMHRVRAVLVRMVRGATPTLRAVAQQLGVGERTLQRQLAAADATFAGILDDVRRELAREHLRHGNIGLSELAFLLGFANPNSFYRAFRRWEQTTPLVYRQRMKSSAKR